MENKFSSFHTHTLFCDGKDDVETMCRTACEKGLAAIGFSAHAPLDCVGLDTNWNMKSERLGEYVDEVRAARRRWEGKIPVYLGLEVDYIKGLRSVLDKDIIDLHLDYIIGSVHYLAPPRGAPFTVDGPAEEVETGIREGFGGDGEAMMNAYWDAVTEMAALGGFDIVGHLDLLKKNNANDRWFNAKSANYTERVQEAARAIAAAGLTVEVNTGGMNRGYLNETYPSLEILRVLRQQDAKSASVPVMITADAHRAADLDGHYHDALQTLLNAGYTNHTLLPPQSSIF